MSARHFPVAVAVTAAKLEETVGLDPSEFTSRNKCCRATVFVTKTSATFVFDVNPRGTSRKVRFFFFFYHNPCFLSISRENDSVFTIVFPDLVQKSHPDFEMMFSAGVWDFRRSPQT